MNIPNLLELESTNKCNANCHICFRTDMITKEHTMTLEEAKSIIDKLVPYKGQGLKVIHPYRLGEPLLNPDLEEILKYAREKMGLWCVLYTNGSLLTEARCRSLFSIPLEQLTFSVDGYGKEYEKLRAGLKWDTLAKNIDTAIRLKDEMNVNTTIGLRYCKVGEWERTDRKLKERFPGVNYVTGQKYDDITIEQVPKLPCKLLNEQLVIDATGELLLCCKYNMHSLGNVHEMDDILKTRNDKLKHLFNETDYRKMPKSCLNCGGE